MADIDTVLSESLKRVVEPGDPTGVAELIRSRVAAGDTGTPSDGGSGFAAGSGWTWLPWAGAGAVVAIVGAAVGASGVFGSLQPAGSAPAPGLSVSQFTSGLDCPGGSAVVSFRPGDRVLAVARSDDSAYLAVRSPFDRADTVWLPVAAVDVDEGEPAVFSLEVGGCPEPVVTVAEPSMPPTPTKPAPTKPPSDPNPPAPVDHAPVVQSVSVSDDHIYSGESTTISAVATDDHGVDTVLISWSGAESSGQQAMTKVGGHWEFVYHENGHFGTVTFTVRAVDTANKTSAPKSVNVLVEYFG
jgi:hypothetical protein